MHIDFVDILLQASGCIMIPIYPVFYKGLVPEFFSGRSNLLRVLCVPRFLREATPPYELRF
jgi:hypothetical protein